MKRSVHIVSNHTYLSGETEMVSKCLTCNKNMTCNLSKRILKIIPNCSVVECYFYNRGNV